MGGGERRPSSKENTKADKKWDTLTKIMKEPMPCDNCHKRVDAKFEHDRCTTECKVFKHYTETGSSNERRRKNNAIKLTQRFSRKKHIKTRVIL